MSHHGSRADHGESHGKRGGHGHGASRNHPQHDGGGHSHHGLGHHKANRPGHGRLDYSGTVDAFVTSPDVAAPAPSGSARSASSPAPEDCPKRGGAGQCARDCRNCPNREL